MPVLGVRVRGGATKEPLILLVCLFLAAVVVLIPASATCITVEQQSANIQDLSGQGSPIQVSGHITIGYDSSKKFPYSFEEHLSVKNVSDKAFC